MENFHAKEPKDGGAVSPPLPYLTIAASPHIMAKSYGKLGGAPGWTRGREPHPCAFTCVSPAVEQRHLKPLDRDRPYRVAIQIPLDGLAFALGHSHEAACKMGGKYYPR